MTMSNFNRDVTSCVPWLNGLRSHIQQLLGLFVCLPSNCGSWPTDKQGISGVVPEASLLASSAACSSKEPRTLRFIHQFERNIFSEVAETQHLITEFKKEPPSLFDELRFFCFRVAESAIPHDYIIFFSIFWPLN
jgi:hypothetical protein